MLRDSRLRPGGSRLAIMLALSLASIGLSSCATASASVNQATTGTSSPACAAATTMAAASAGSVSGSSTTSGSSQPTPEHPCWTEVQPYPFGSEGGPVDTSSALCAPSPSGEQIPSCYLTVSSMAFRAWNRGLAATEATSGTSDPFVVWLFNGARWYPDPTFPGQAVCKGNTILWAGKLDYWLIGAGSQNWPSLCRFDGVNFVWEPLPLPEATLQHVAVPGSNPRRLEPGGITSGACLAWNNCWFFGTYGTVVHWDGKALSDATPPFSQGWLQTEYTAAVARQGTAGQALGLAVGATSERAAALGPLPSQPDGSPPPQLYAWNGSVFSPLSLAVPSIPQPGDPYRTDLVAVDLDAEGQGWVAGNPEGYRATFDPGPDGTPANGRLLPSSPQPAPLLPVSTSGPATGCAGPSQERFAFTSSPLAPLPAEAFPGAFLWSSVGVAPGTGEALAGGRMRAASAGPGPNEDQIGQPTIAQVACDGAATVTRFRASDPTYSGPEPAPEAPADRGGTVTAIAANAPNDAWAATSRGALQVPGITTTLYFQPPRLYRLSNGLPPAAPEGNDEESRPLELQEDPPIIVVEPEPPPPPAPTRKINKTRRVKLRPAIYAVKTKLDRHLRLHLTFRLRRPVTIGAEALRYRTVVGMARPRRFAGRNGVLVIALSRTHWPTKIRFIMPARKPAHKSASSSARSHAPLTETRQRGLLE
jgi:hypothetical protein